MTTNIPRIFELNLSRLLVWVTALVRYFSMIFSYAHRGAGDSLGLSFPQQYLKCQSLCHILTIREERKLLLQLPAPGPYSYPLSSFLPLFLWQPDPFPHPWVTLLGFVFADEKFLKLTRDLLPSPNGEGEPKQRGSAPGFSPCICQQHKLRKPRVLTAERLLEGWEPFLKFKDF